MLNQGGSVVTKQLAMIDRLEQCLGETICYFRDAIDLPIRQGDSVALEKLAMLQEAHILAAKLLKQLEQGD